MPRDVTIVNIADVQLLGQSHGRSVNLQVKPLPLDTGVPGLRMEPTWLIAPKGYGTPRHRHVFDQIRYVIEGEWVIGKGVGIKAGECGYFPEGVYYGPQLQEADCSAFILQFQGPSGIPYLTHAELRAAQKRLESEGGIFEDGVYTRQLPDGRKINADSHKACWEAVTGEEEVFPEGRFREPVIMRSQACAWRPDRKVPGMEHKHLGTFAELRTGVSLVRLASGARLPAGFQDEAEIRYLLDGSVSYGGKTYQGGGTQEKGTYFYLPHETDVKDFISETGATFFVISLPMIREMEESQRSRVTATAA